MPGAQLALPLAQHGGGAHHQAGAVQPAVVQRAQKGGQLHCLAKAHLVTDDPPGALRVQLPEPLHAGALVVKEAAVDVAGHAQPPFEAHVFFGGVRGVFAT